MPSDPAPWTPPKPLEWGIAGVAVSIGIALIVAPLAITPTFTQTFARYGAIDELPLLSRLVLSLWFPPLLGIGPAAVAMGLTTGRMPQRKRRALLLLTALLALGAVGVYLWGLGGPIVGIAEGASHRLGDGP